MVLSDADDLFLPAGLGVIDSVVRAALGLCDLELGCGPSGGDDASTQRWEYRRQSMHCLWTASEQTHPSLTEQQLYPPHQRQP